MSPVQNPGANPLTATVQPHGDRGRKNFSGGGRVKQGVDFVYLSNELISGSFKT